MSLRRLMRLPRSIAARIFAAQTSPVYMGDERLLARVLGEYRMFVCASDLGFATHILMDGVWEYPITKFVVDTIKPGMVTVDVGANFGYYTLLMADLARPSGICVALEPNPDIVPFLRDSVAVNGLASQCRVHSVAVGRAAGEARMTAPRREPKNGSLHRGPELPNDAIHTVAVRSLDEVLAGEPRVDFIKIDAEGSEADIIEGMKHTLRQHKPRLLIEFNTGHSYDGAVLIGTLLEAYGVMNFVDERGRARSISAEGAIAKGRLDDVMLYFTP